MTGAGKTTFISKVTGRTDLEIGHSLTSCTRDIQVIETKIDGQSVSFVDTPGFSDTHMSDTEVLQLIADYLAAAYKRDMKLSGIIYLHPISDTRVTHHATKNLQMFQKLTGEKNLKNVVLATSMWDKVSPDEGAAREQELKDKFWKVLIAYEAKALRYAGTTESAQRMVSQMLANNKPFYLQLQEEMGKDNKALRDTAAGREVMVELERLKNEHRREVKEMEEMLRHSAEENRTVVEALKEHYHGRLVELEKTLRDERTMNEEAVRALTNRIEDLESRGTCDVM
ncbi:P-loop containing nucleoside triphosphate hydrolase protein [Apiospora saccharicola]|uniref:P-loop containing nucleoside triphosphate hydrolase protein n=1 Tax=Apiospora saccharicola TaxID=335842 RepID=A0ABR1WKG4_9PEZI